MDISAGLAAQLAALTRALDADVDLERQIAEFVAHVRTVIPSFLGMTLTVVVDGHELNFTVSAHTDATAETAASLRIPLDSTPDGPAGSRIVLFAAKPGTFVDLAADLSYLLTLPPTALALDSHLHAPNGEAATADLAGQSMINQAVGVLIERGHPLESAHAELRRLAELDGGSLEGAAEALLRDAVDNPSADDGPT